VSGLVTLVKALSRLGYAPLVGKHASGPPPDPNDEIREMFRVDIDDRAKRTGWQVCAVTAAGGLSVWAISALTGGPSRTLAFRTRRADRALYGVHGHIRRRVSGTRTGRQDHCEGGTAVALFLCPPWRQRRRRTAGCRLAGRSVRARFSPAAVLADQLYIRRRSFRSGHLCGDSAAQATTDHVVKNTPKHSAIVRVARAS